MHRGARATRCVPLATPPAAGAAHRRRPHCAARWLQAGLRHPIPREGSGGTQHWTVAVRRAPVMHRKEGTQVQVQAESSVCNYACNRYHEPRTTATRTVALLTPGSWELRSSSCSSCVVVTGDRQHNAGRQCQARGRNTGVRNAYTGRTRIGARHTYASAGSNIRIGRRHWPPTHPRWQPTHPLHVVTAALHVTLQRFSGRDDGKLLTLRTQLRSARGFRL